MGLSGDLGDGECRGEREEGVSGVDDKAAGSISLLFSRKTEGPKSSFSGCGMVSRNCAFLWMGNSLGIGVSFLCLPRDFSAGELVSDAVSLLYCHWTPSSLASPCDFLLFRFELFFL